jgi:hypothetical protein
MVELGMDILRYCLANRNNIKLGSICCYGTRSMISDNAKENGLVSGHMRNPSIVELTQIVSDFCGPPRYRFDHMS